VTIAIPMRPPPPNVPEPEGHCENNDGQQPPSTGKTGKLIQEEATGDELIRGDDDRREQEPDRKRIVRTCRSHRWLWRRGPGPSQVEHSHSGPRSEEGSRVRGGG
jgi:hypothetical protein